MTSNIWLIRHGETNENATRILQTPDSTLSDNGLRQADALANRLKGSEITDVLHSDMTRAQQTAQALIKATGAQGHQTSLLQERNFGDLRGRAYDSVGADFFAADYHPPGGESWQQFHARVDEAWKYILSRLGATAGDLAVVTHGLVCRAIIERHTQLDGVNALPDKFSNTSVNLIEGIAPFKVKLLNCASHLNIEQVNEGAGAV